MKFKGEKKKYKMKEKSTQGEKRSNSLNHSKSKKFFGHDLKLMRKAPKEGGSD